jgi:amino acid adenylation domain-containing protein
MGSAANIEAAFPLSPLQQGMLFHSLSAPGSAIYVVQIRCEVRGTLRIESFQQAWQHVLDRHQVLRAAFVWEGVEQPLQVIGRRVRLPFRQSDWRGMAESVQRRHLETWARRDRTLGFTLGRAPLMRILLAQLEDDRYEIVWTLHHIICDGWSRPILLGEFWRAYAALTKGQPIVLPPAPPYSRYLTSLPRDSAASEGFWRSQLAGMAGPTPLGIEETIATGAAPDAQGEGERQLTEAETAALDRWSRAAGVSLGTLLAAAWAIVLHAYSGRQSVLFGLTVSGRSGSGRSGSARSKSGRPGARADLETLVGLCINTLPLCVRVPEAEPLVPWLRALQLQSAQLREHEHTPLAQIHKWSAIPGSQPLFESIVVFENFPVDTGTAARDASGMAMTVSGIRGFDKNNYPLTLVATPGSRLSLMAAYDPARFGAASIEALLRHLTTVLAGFSAGEMRTVSDVSLLAAEERQQVVVEWNRAEMVVPPASLLPQLERQAIERPDGIAVLCEGQTLPYAALHERANQLAHVLRARGVGPDVRVAVCLPRGLDLIVALLAVWKAGGAYVPLDPDLPPARIVYIVRDAEAMLVITTAALGAHVPQDDGHARPLYIDGDVDLDLARRSAPPVVAPLVDVTAENLAYVIYTSGSTGRPKGVGVTHGNIASLFAATAPMFACSHEDVWTLFHSAAFDFSVWEMWGALAYGGRLVIVSSALARTPESFARLLRAEGVTVLNQTPSAFRALQAVAETADEALRLVIFGGEALPCKSLRPWLARHGASRPQLVNMYGITETTVHVTSYQLTAADVASATTSRIGRALPHLQLYVLDPSLRPVPVGVVGEIYVGGAGVARGYLGRPELTATRFVPDPCGREAGGRLYRAGDLGRWRADGVCEFLGRADQQVKLRGYRIEPGEIEAVLRDQPGIRDALVLLREDVERDPQLVAYVVADTSQPLLTDRLQQALRRVHPEYMVPSIIVPIAALPLTANGKIDRRALPAPAAVRPTLVERYTAPRSTTESTLAQVWAEVLRVDRVGIHDNFYALGGDSMRAIQIQAKAREGGLGLSLEQLMRAQTIAELAAHLDPAPTADATGVTRPFDLVSPDDRARLPQDVADAYPLTELQAGMLFHSELDPQSALYHDVISFHVRVPFDPVAFAAALGDVVAAHPILRTSVHMAGYREPLQLVHRDPRIPLQLHDLRGLAADEQGRLLSAFFDEQRRTRFDWTQAPLFHLHVHRRSDDAVQCTLLCHHAILDGWSTAAMFTELFSTYLARLGVKTSPPIVPPRATFRDYVAHERAAVAGDADRAYWTAYLADSAPTVVPRLPSRAPIRSGPMLISQTRMLARPVAEGLARAAERASVPLKSVLLAGHLRVLAFVANARDVVTGLVTHGRPGLADADRVLGLFLNTLPLRCIVEGSWIDLARRVFAIECDQAPHRYSPMSSLLRVMGGQPLFDAAFNFMHFHVYQALVGMPSLSVIDGTSQADTNFPLLTQCTLHGATGDIDVRIDANRSEFTDEQVRQLMDYYERAYAAFANHPERHSTVSLMSDRERDQVIVAWNRTAQPHRLDRGVQHLMALQAERVPEAIAIVDGARQLTYREFWRRVVNLAAALRRLGVGLDTCVGVCIPRSAEAAVAVAATLEAGGAYVALDPIYPDARLAWMARDAALRVILTTRTLAPRFAGIETALVCLDGEADGTRPGDVPRTIAPDRAPPALPSHPDSLAYVMYTSGSTGQPKGVGVTHRCLTNLIEWHLRELGGGMRTLQFASLGFDPSIHEMAVAWCSGATLVFLPDAIRADAQAIARELQAQAIEKFMLPPVVLQQLAEHCAGQPSLFSTLRQLQPSGEQLRLTQPVIDLLSALPDCVLHNHYGPAETHVVTGHPLRGSASSWPTHPPIGRPIDNTQIYLLDRRMEPVPVGTPGELFIGGVSLGRGYGNRPDLTAAAFVPDALGMVPGARLYRTGDLARWLPDGTIDFLGRIATRQVKISGYRIELGEIETALMRHPGVGNTVVVLRDYGPDDRRLVAYVIPSTPAVPTTTELRAFLARTLPAFMLPAAFVVLDAFPLNTNGKIDRRTLPDPQTQGRPVLATRCVPPDTPAERLIASVFEAVLRVDGVGVEDDFFERGGHSLLATQAIVRVREAFAVEIPLRALFDRPTVRGLIDALAEMLGGRPLVDEIARAVREVAALSDADVRAALSDSASRPGEYVH